MSLVLGSHTTFENDGVRYVTLWLLKESILVGWKVFPPDFDLVGTSRSDDLMAAFEAGGPSFLPNTTNIINKSISV